MLTLLIMTAALLELSPADGVLPSPWMVKTKHGVARVRVAAIDGRRAVCLDSRAASFSIQRPARIDTRSAPLLEWTWLAQKLPSAGDLRDSDRDDQAAQLFVAFGNRTAISYVWDSNAPVGTVTSTRIPFVVNIRIVVVQSGAANTNTWITHHRNLREDYLRLFGTAAPATVDAVRFQINSQYTHADAAACLAAVAFQ